MPDEMPEENTHKEPGKEIPAAELSSPYIPLFLFLQTPQGQELASKVVAFFEGIRKDFHDRKISDKSTRNLFIMQSFAFVITVIAVSVLAVLDKFSPALGLFFGTIIGYLFGSFGKKTP